jgi:glycosyltransferase involved in cell wall biosynthesis
LRVLVIHNAYKFLGGEDIVFNQEVMAYQKLGYEVKTLLKSNKTLNLFDIIFCLWNPKSYLETKRLVKTFRPDIIHIHNFIFKLSPSIFWALNKNTKVYLTIHNYRFLCPSGTLFIDGQVDLSSKKHFGLLKNIFKGVFQKSVLKTALLVLIFKFNEAIGSFKRINTFIFLTIFSRDIHVDWKKEFFNKNRIKPNFLKEFNLEPSNVCIDIIFVGRISEEKGLAKVLPILSKYDKLTFAIVGEGLDYEKLKLQYQKCLHIKFYGKQSHENTLALLQKSKFLLFPSIWYEGMPMTIIESFSLGKPVIAHNFGAMNAMIKHKLNGLLYSSNEELDDILDNLSLADYVSLSNNARKEFESNYSQRIGLENLKKL